MLLFIQQFLLETIRLLGEMAPYLTLGFVLAGLLHVFVPKSVIAGHLGKNSIGSAMKAAMVGVPLPLCSCGVVPTAMGLLHRGASRAATVAFLISTPQTGVDSIAVTFGFFGWIFAIFRPIAAFVSGIVGGIAVLLLKQAPENDEHWQQYHKASEDALETEMDGRTFSQKLVEGARFSFIELLGDIALWLVVGLAVAALIAMVVPDDFFADKLGRDLVTMLVMMALGIPLYVCSTASIPIAAVLMTKGISAGAAFVFLMTGPATNAATMLIIGRVMGWRVLGMYLSSIAIFALAFGLGLDALLAQTGWTVNPAMTHEHGMNPWIMWGSAGLLTFFIIYHFYNSLTKRFITMTPKPSDKPTLDLIVEGMTCSHCVRTVTQSLQNVSGVDSVTVTLENGSAHIEGENLDRTKLVSAVESIGYKVMN
jgi:uncharacterized membrane protein YraQ (UPF0718 family)/copper chaperone CopZ